MMNLYVIYKMSDMDIIKNTRTLLPTDNDMRVFQHIYTELDMKEEDAFAMLARIMRRYNGRATMENVANDFIAESARRRSTTLNQMVDRLTDDSSDTVSFSSAVQSSPRTPDHKGTMAPPAYCEATGMRPRTFAEILQSPARKVVEETAIIHSRNDAQIRARPRVVDVCGTLLESDYIANSGVFDYIERNPGVSAKLCVFRTDCYAGDNCSFVHMKLYTEPAHLCGIPLYVRVGDKFVSASRFCETECFERLRKDPHTSLIRCEDYSGRGCQYGKKCPFAHYR